MIDELFIIYFKHYNHIYKQNRCLLLHKLHRNLNEFKLCTCINASTLLLITKAMSFGTGGNTAKILQASLTIYDISYYIKQHRNACEIMPFAKAKSTFTKRKSYVFWYGRKYC